jgi:uncharacterized membrane protein YcaP (DUF421 family)
VDPLRIAVRAVFGFIFLLALVRTSGKRTIKQGSPFDFAMALILGDMVDDLLWAEVAVSQFVVACGVLVLTHTVFDIIRFRLSERQAR